VGDPIWIKLFRVVHNDMLTAVTDMIETETRSTIPIWIRPKVRHIIWRTFGRIQWHVIPKPCVTLQVLPPGEFNNMTPEPRATLQGAAADKYENKLTV